MFELTNEQRRCFALATVHEEWERMELKPSPNDQHKTYIYLDGNTIVKCILVGEAQYCEFDLFDKISHDKKHLLPKTPMGKPTRLSASTLLNRKNTGMQLFYKLNQIYLDNPQTQCYYYSNCYLNEGINNLDTFSRWVETWCEETTDADHLELLQFSQQKRRHVHYKEGDVFRFKISRRLYGYGRILLDYNEMRKRKEPFWDVLMGKPLVCSVYHIVTERKEVSLEELSALPSLPSTIIADNALYYGEYDIIGNIPITECEDHPILYGDSIHVREKAVCYQCGRVYRKIEGQSAIYNGFRNNGVSFRLNLTLDILLQCIKEKSNTPYWSSYIPYAVEKDLRNPKHGQKLQEIINQMNL